MLADAKLSKVEGSQGIEETEEVLILLEERKNTMKARKTVVDAVMK